MSSFDFRFRLPDDYDMCGRCAGSGRHENGLRCERCDGRGVLRRRRQVAAEGDGGADVVVQPPSGREALARAKDAKRRLVEAISREIADAPTGEPLQMPSPVSRWAPPVDPRWVAQCAAWRGKLDELRRWIDALDAAASTTGEKVGEIVDSWRSVPRIWLGLLHFQNTLASVR